ncbi:VCBS repeat-containing protein [Roseibacterium beibuensis]|uniref:FG-GAP repeat domain-containing protein n=1 Tax=[Roseibacterium] beibuensis TaxID=1193142 RepID=UPI00217E941C|nr:VCBS repeat-containing protein [Roseibacterium beibuensis]MCS6626222.1 VCBS repeat-containing protein [Roseibacterium beibuensis]
MTFRIASLTLVAFGLAAAPALADPAFRFEDVTATHLPDSVLRNSMDVGVADLDGDGDLDVVVPQEFRLNKMLLNQGGGRFADASDRIPALTAEELAGGPPQLQFSDAGHDSEDVSVADFDGDGVLDVIIVAEDDVRFGRTQVHEYLRGLGGGRFERVRPGLPDMEADAVAHADLDADGDIDLLIAGAGQDRLLLNDRGGAFVDVTADHLPPEDKVTQDIETADLDGDGDLDLVLGQEGGHALWLNDGRGRFTDASDRLPAPGNVEARKVTPADVDGDGDLDLYFSHVGWQEREPQDRLLINDGAGRFADESAARIPAETGTTLTARFADLDGDGDLDLVRGEHGPLTVWANDGAGVFTDISSAVLPHRAEGPNIALALADFDGDGRIDIYIGQLKAGRPDETIRDRLLLNRPA